MDQLDGGLRESKEDRMKQQMEEDIAEVKAAGENEKKISRKRETTMQSICVATDKRKRLQITKKNMVC